MGSRFGLDVVDNEYMLEEVKKLLKPTLRGPYGPLVKALFDDKPLMKAFTMAPGAVRVHHAYLGGLLEHTLGVVRLAHMVSQLYSPLDLDLLLVGAFVHDIGKVREYRYDWKIDYTDEGRLIGHTVLGVHMIEGIIEGIPTLRNDQERRMLLTHLILSHHGEVTTGAVQPPMTREAMALHLVDNLDARMASLNRIYADLQGCSRWTPYDSLYGRRFFSTPVESDGGEIPSGGKSLEPPHNQLSLTTLFGK